MTRLLMWDIDLTLLHIGGVTRLAYAAAFLQMTGREPLVYPNFAGRTDLDAAHEVFALHGIAGPDVDEFLARYAKELLARAWATAMFGKAAGHGIDDPAFLQPARPMSAIGG